MSNFIMLIGLPASGKDAWAKEYIKEHPNTQVYSSDDIRKELYGDASHQGSPAKIFELMRSRTLSSLREDKDVIYNATNVSFKDRRGILSQVKNLKKEVKITGIILATPLKVCKERNCARERVVPNFVFNKMLSRWQTPFYNEGFNEIKVITDPQSEVAKEYSGKVFHFGDQKNPHHTFSLYEHCLRCYMSLISQKAPVEVCLAGLFHDWGKIFTQTFDEEGIAHYYQHENYSAYMVLEMGGSLEMAQLINYHMLPYNYKGGEATWRVRLGEELWQKVLMLHQADKEAH